MALPPKSKHDWLLQDPDVTRWIRNMERGSALTADVAFRRMGRACELLGMKPQDMVLQAKGNPKAFQDKLEDIVMKLELENKAPQYIANIIKTVRSWLRYSDITLTRKIKIRNAGSNPTTEDEQVPTHEELASILRSASSRVRVAIALIAFSDLRPESLGNHDGSDGLKIADLPELSIRNDKVEFQTIPTMVIVRSPISKARHKYFTFLSAEGCAYLKEYLHERMRNGEKLTSTTPIIGHERSEVAKKPFMMTTKITHLIRQTMRRAGVYKRPYVLRACAETQLIISESRGKISHPYLKFIAGHRGDIEARYSTNKGRLLPEMIEDMRNSYKQCEPFLSTLAQPIEQMTVVKEAKIEALKSLAKSMFGLDLLDVKIAKEREKKKTLTQDETIELFETEMTNLREQPDPQTMVEEKELKTYLKNGWQFVSVLPSKKIIVKK